MADDLTSLQAQLATLKNAYRSGARRVSYDGKNVDYGTTQEMREAIAALENDIATMQGTKPVRTILVRSHKGW